MALSTSTRELSANSVAAKLKMLPEPCGIRHKISVSPIQGIPDVVPKMIRSSSAHSPLRIRLLRDRQGNEELVLRRHFLGKAWHKCDKRWIDGVWEGSCPACLAYGLASKEHHPAWQTLRPVTDYYYVAIDLDNLEDGPRFLDAAAYVHETIQQRIKTIKETPVLGNYYHTLKRSFVRKHPLFRYLDNSIFSTRHGCDFVLHCTMNSGFKIFNTEFSCPTDRRHELDKWVPYVPDFLELERSPNYQVTLNTLRRAAPWVDDLDGYTAIVSEKSTGIESLL